MKPQLPALPGVQNAGDNTTEPTTSAPINQRVLDDSQHIATASGVDAKTKISYSVSVFRWSDGKYGGTVIFKKHGVDGEENTLANEVNNFAARSLRSLDETLKAIFTQ